MCMNKEEFENDPKPMAIVLSTDLNGVNCCDVFDEDDPNLHAEAFANSLGNDFITVWHGNKASREIMVERRMKIIGL